MKGVHRDGVMLNWFEIKRFDLSEKPGFPTTLIFFSRYSHETETICPVLTDSASL